MIRVKKRPIAPDGLGKGELLTERDKKLFDDHREKYLSGAAKFDFKPDVYGGEPIKRAIKEDQNAKCCFCEGMFDAHVAGDVEHFRPKGAVKVKGRKQYPGYYWLAYSWQNLYYCCPDCNQYRKREQFPVEDEESRARTHHDPIEWERPLLIDPGGSEDPRQHIRFDKDWPIGLTAKGRETIRVLKLDREALNIRRRKHLKELARLRDTISDLERYPDSADLVVELRTALASALDPSSEFQAAAEDFLAGWQRPVES